MSPVPPPGDSPQAPASSQGDPRLRAPAWRVPDERAAGARARWLALICVALGAWYLLWLLQARRVGAPALYGLLIAAETFNFVQAAGFWWTCAHQRVRRPPAAPPPEASVDVLIPVYDEPAEIVASTLAAAARLQDDRTRVWLLDDGRSPEMQRLAQRLRVGYLRRDDNTGAKAGNINRALARTSGEFVVVLDCDHVARPHLLSSTLPYFSADARLAYVQTPQYYGNQAASPIARAAAAQQALFFGPIARGKDGLGAMFCAGTNVVFRRAALLDAGGFPEGSLTEDFELSIRLHERGWHSAYHPEVLAVGLGPEDMASYVSQQQRWARGCLGALPKVMRARLPLRVRAQYLLSASYFLSGWTLLVYMSLPVVRILFGLQPLAATTADQFLLHFAPYYCGALAAVALAGEGAYTYGAFALAAGAFWVHVHASAGALLRRPARFVVTPKQGARVRQPRAVAPALAALAALLGASLYGLARSHNAATLNNVAFAALHSAVLASAVLPALVLRRSRALREEAPAAPRPARRRPWTRPALAGVVALGLLLPASLAAIGGAELGPGSSLSSDADEAAAGFMSAYVRRDGRVVRRDQGGDTVSEGQSYAMLLAVALDDRATFARVWGWTRGHLQRPDGLLAYRWQGGRVVGGEAAADADLDSAFALALAAERFGVPAYRAQAAVLGRATLARETSRVAGGLVLVAGPWAAGEPRVVDASYFSPGAYAALARASPDPRWGALLASSRTVVRSLAAGGRRLVSDWADVGAEGSVSAAGGPAPSGGGTPASGLDAVRVAVWDAAACAGADRRAAAALWPLYRGHPGYVSYSLDGRPRGSARSAASFVAAAAAARAAGAVGASEALLAAASRWNSAHPAYYGAAWLALGRVLLTSRALGGCRR
jgi:cellulose synthase (UDP-forming)